MPRPTHVKTRLWDHICEVLGFCELNGQWYKTNCTSLIRTIHNCWVYPFILRPTTSQGRFHESFFVCRLSGRWANGWHGWQRLLKKMERRRIEWWCIIAIVVIVLVSACLPLRSSPFRGERLGKCGSGFVCSNQRDSKVIGYSLSQFFHWILIIRYVGFCGPPSHFVFPFSHSFNLYLVFLGVHLHALSQWRLCFVYHKISCWLKLGLQPGAFLGCPGHSYNESVSTEALIMNCICHSHPECLTHV
jgi:hypothetical protein